MLVTSVNADDIVNGHVGALVDDLPLTDFRALSIESFGDLFGQAVMIYEVADAPPGSPEAALNRSRIRRGNNLHESFAHKGLVVLAVIPVQGIEHMRVAREQDIRSPYCRYEELANDKSRREVIARLGWTFASGVLIDPLGFLCDVDGVAPLDVNLYASAALPTSISSWEGDAKGVARNLKRRRFAAAWKEAQRLRATHPDLADQINGLCNSAIDVTEILYMEGSPHSAWMRLEQLKEDLGDTQVESRLTDISRSVSADTAFGTQLRAHIEMRELINKTAPTPRKAKRILPALESWIDGHRGTRFGHEARMWRRYYSDVVAEG